MFEQHWSVDQLDVDATIQPNLRFRAACGLQPRGRRRGGFRSVSLGLIRLCDRPIEGGLFRWKGPDRAGVGPDRIFHPVAAIPVGRLVQDIPRRVTGDDAIRPVVPGNRSGRPSSSDTWIRPPTEERPYSVHASCRPAAGRCSLVRKPAWISISNSRW
jgi:hypothetical protein